MIPIDITDDMIIRAYKRRDELYAFTDWSKHDENSCETCKMLEEQEKEYCRIVEINKVRIANYLETIDNAYRTQVQGHCPVCFSPLFDGNCWCSEKCYELWKNQTKSDKLTPPL